MLGVRHLLWAVPLLLTGGDALAWGLYTHVFFAQMLVWAVPLADPRFLRAARRFPKLVLAGACVPDLSLVARVANARELDATHEWQLASRILTCAHEEPERAVALGYTSHLFVDIIAHHHFVPAHERVWFEVPIITHAFAEWAMDHHVATQLFETPARLLTREAGTVVPLVARVFGCSDAQVEAGIEWLARGERLLRSSRLPQGIHASARYADARLKRRFSHYLMQTTRRLPQINRVLAGEQPWWKAEVCPSLARSALAPFPMPLVRARLPLPQDLFQMPSTMLANTAPIAAPASTSLG